MNAIAPPLRARAAKRTRVLMTGTLFSPYGAQRVRIRDIAATGAQVLLEAEIPADCDAILKRGELFVAGRVTRVVGRETGLQFYRELSQAEIERAFHSVVR